MAERPSKRRRLGRRFSRLRPPSAAAPAPLRVRCALSGEELCRVKLPPSAAVEELSRAVAAELREPGVLCRVVLGGAVPSGATAVRGLGEEVSVVRMRLQRCLGSGADGELCTQLTPCGRCRLCQQCGRCGQCGHCRFEDLHRALDEVHVGLGGVSSGDHPFTVLERLLLSRRPLASAPLGRVADAAGRLRPQLKEEVLRMMANICLPSRGDVFGALADLLRRAADDEEATSPELRAKAAVICGQLLGQVPMAWPGDGADAAPAAAA